MAKGNLIRSLRSVLENPQESSPLHEVLEQVDEFVLECTSGSSKEPAEVLLHNFDQELQSLHHEVIDYSSTYHTEVFLAVLYHLGSILPPTSVISWFDLVLRPALREPKLPTVSLNHAKELIISALQKTQDVYTQRVQDFRRRLLELYLLDAYNESSESDALEWAELKEEEQVKRTRWKHNLQDILVSYGHERPEDLFTELDLQFAVPTYRLQLLILLNKFSGSPEFPSSVPVIANHNLVNSLRKCLLLDNSATVCTAALTFLIQLLPYFAVHTKMVLRSMLPVLFAIMARLLCWKERLPPPPKEGYNQEFEKELYTDTTRVFHMAPGSDWERLEMSFHGTTSVPPSPRYYFTMIYYLYPSNTLKFIRAPAKYINDSNLPSPYTEPWEQVFDHDEIRRESENLMREHICHPFLIWSDAASELTRTEFWSKYDVPRIVSEATMLDIRYLSIGLRERYGNVNEAPSGDGQDEDQTHFIKAIDLSSKKIVISLQDMIDASVALKSNIDVEITKPYKRWSSLIFPHPQAKIPSDKGDKQKEIEPLFSKEVEAIALPHVAEVVSGLQKEVLLLRNELNFELWHSRENAKHVGRLYEDRILMRSAESERQGLYNKLRKYRSQVTALENELRENKQQSALAKTRYADWTKELQDKLKALREERKKLASETAAVRSSEENLKALFAAQGKRLSDALQQVFTLQAEQKQNVEQIEQLKDYERQIEALTKLRQTWEDDSRKFSDFKEVLAHLQQANQDLEFKLQAKETEHAREKAEEAQEYTRKIQSLELRLAQMEGIADQSVVQESQKHLFEENIALKSEIEELQAVISTMSGQRDTS
ncbi:hypothetical protein FA15DRAFT_679018 [Coprinopsis marcescibilis]|uniref:Tuberous sclerosis 1 n=1 Tax=Coprinopsis marcescibilis TaxID=230819 RepID=A0A5C3L3F4_COPMA|nr:hypothetical protein FA15DRAFT_679018 [Coprinopsis marcescibilis]